MKDGKLLALPHDNLILEGIRYELMEELARRSGIPFEARRISQDEVRNADELLLTAATRRQIGRASCRERV